MTSVTGDGQRTRGRGGTLRLTNRRKLGIERVTEKGDRSVQFRSYSQNARVDAGVQVKPGQHGGNCGGHCCPLAAQLGPDKLPVPVRSTTCGLPVALSVMEMVPLRFPAAVGSKVTSIVQFAPTAIIESQSSVSPKFVLASILVIRKDAVPELATLTGIAELVPPTTSVPKPTVVADKATFGVPPPNDASPPPQPPSGHRPRSASVRQVLTNKHHGPAN